MLDDVLAELESWIKDHPDGVSVAQVEERYSVGDWLAHGLLLELRDRGRVLCTVKKDPNRLEYVWQPR